MKNVTLTPQEKEAIRNIEHPSPSMGRFKTFMNILSKRKNEEEKAKKTEPESKGEAGSIWLILEEEGNLPITIWGRVEDLYDVGEELGR